MATISVLMTVYNSEKYLKEAVDSIINQTMEDYELIIVDDGSTDKSLNLLYEYDDPRIIIVKCKNNNGVACARNIGLDYCLSDYIAIMDSDDISVSSRLEKQYQFLQSHPEIDGVYARFRCLDEYGKLLGDGNAVAYNNYKYVNASMLLHNVIANCGMMFRRQIIVDNHLKYDETWKIGSDYKFWCDFIQYGKIVGMNDVLWYYRLRNNGLYNGSKLKERIDCEKNMKLYNFKSYGFSFSEEEKNILLKVFDTQGKIESRSEMILLYDALVSIIQQAKSKNLEFKEEIQILCKKQFISKIQNSEELWGVV